MPISRLMVRAKILAICAATCLLGIGGCTTASTSRTGGPVSSPKNQHGPSDTRLPSRHFKVSLPLEGRAARWKTVATFRYGPKSGQLGFRAAPGLNPLLPSAASITNSGIWVADPVKNRVAHFARSGRYLGEVTGLSTLAGDMVQAADGRIVVLDDPPHSVVKWFRPGMRSLSQPIAEAVGEDPGEDVLYVLIRTDHALGIWADEQHPLTTHLQMQRDVLGVPSESGLLRIHQGVVRRGSKILGEITLTWTARGRDTIIFSDPHVQELHVGIRTFQEYQGESYLWLTAADGARGGQFFLRISPSGRPSRVIKVADAWGAVTPNNARPLLIGPGGTVFQWYTGRRHAELRRAPRRFVR